ncbi:MAG: peptide deformylase [Candidatus Doudnabacteria bacterium]|nr:peptide deformylase [Candidatus Doudnabacteria bacterium]
MILPILTYPNPILRKPTQPVTFPLSKEAQKLARDMIDTVKNADGIGLAAPQVGKSLKIIVINLDKSGIPPTVLYNARIKKKSWRKTEVEEGCLSIPGVFGMVKRPKKTTVEAEDASGNKIEITDQAWVSRVAQHEIDHTNGVLIIDLIKKYTKGEELAKRFSKT